MSSESSNNFNLSLLSAFTSFQIKCWMPSPSLPRR